MTGHRMFMNMLNKKGKQVHFQCLDHRQDKHRSPSLFKAKFMASCLLYYMFSQGKVLPGNSSVLQCLTIQCSFAGDCDLECL